MTLIRCQWTGEGFVPTRPYMERADRDFVVGQLYDVDATQPRSKASHSHYFARLHEFWMNLPEGLTLEYPSAEHLRKRVLIKLGYNTQRDIVCASDKSALSLATMLREMDTYSVVEVHGQVVRLWQAKSQSAREMNKQEFQESKQAVLDEVEAMIWLKVEALNDAGAPAVADAT